MCFRYEAPEGYSLSGCNEGQLWAEDVEGSELWLVRMPAEVSMKMHLVIDISHYIVQLIYMSQAKLKL